jgi:hypothetical protein
MVWIPKPAASRASRSIVIMDAVKLSRKPWKDE